MGSSCKGFCADYDKKGPRDAYIHGYKRCQVCDYFIEINGNYCLCCGMRLRYKPRLPRSKDKYRKVMQVEVYRY